MQFGGLTDSLGLAAGFSLSLMLALFDMKAPCAGGGHFVTCVPLWLALPLVAKKGDLRL